MQKGYFSFLYAGPLLEVFQLLVTKLCMSETETVLHMHTKVCPATPAKKKKIWLGKRVGALFTDHNNKENSNEGTKGNSCMCSSIQRIK
jgi:hypothetical protein